MLSNSFQGQKSVNGDSIVPKFIMSNINEFTEKDNEESITECTKELKPMTKDQFKL